MSSLPTSPVVVFSAPSIGRLERTGPRRVDPIPDATDGTLTLLVDDPPLVTLRWTKKTATAATTGNMLELTLMPQDATFAPAGPPEKAAFVLRLASSPSTHVFFNIRPESKHTTASLCSSISAILNDPAAADKNNNSNNNYLQTPVNILRPFPIELSDIFNSDAAKSAIDAAPADVLEKLTQLLPQSQSHLSDPSSTAAASDSESDTTELRARQRKQHILRTLKSPYFATFLASLTKSLNRVPEMSSVLMALEVKVPQGGAAAGVLGLLDALNKQARSENP